MTIGMEYSYQIRQINHHMHQISFRYFRRTRPSYPNPILLQSYIPTPGVRLQIFFVCTNSKIRVAMFPGG